MNIINWLTAIKIPDKTTFHLPVFHHVPN